jgi:hypothetical protein
MAEVSPYKQMRCTVVSTTRSAFRFHIRLWLMALFLGALLVFVPMLAGALLVKLGKVYVSAVVVGAPRHQSQSGR